MYYKEFEQAEIKVHQNIDEIKEESQELLNLLNDIMQNLEIIIYTLPILKQIISD